MSNEFRPDIPWKFVDWDRLQDALAKLIENAEKDKKDKADLQESVYMYSDKVDEMNKEIKKLKLLLDTEQKSNRGLAEENRLLVAKYRNPESGVFNEFE
jgi:hypothetical protein